MIRHIAMFKFLPEAGGRTKEENVAITREMLEALPAVIPQIKAQTVALNAPGADEKNCDLVLVADFESLEDLEIYRVHPRHVAVGEFMGPVRESRSCVDFEL